MQPSLKRRVLVPLHFRRLPQIPVVNGERSPDLPAYIRCDQKRGPGPARGVNCIEALLPEDLLGPTYCRSPPRGALVRHLQEALNPPLEAIGDALPAAESTDYTTRLFGQDIAPERHPLYPRARTHLIQQGRITLLRQGIRHRKDDRLPAVVGEMVDELKTSPCPGIGYRWVQIGNEQYFLHLRSFSNGKPPYGLDSGRYSPRRGPRCTPQRTACHDFRTAVKRESSNGDLDSRVCNQ